MIKFLCYSVMCRTNSSVSIIVESDDHDIALTAARIHHHQLGNTLTCVHLSDARVCILKSIQLKHKLGIIHTATCKCELRSYHFKKKNRGKKFSFFSHNTSNFKQVVQSRTEPRDSFTSRRFILLPCSKSFVVGFYSCI